jgi:hypothetical protein
MPKQKVACTKCEDGLMWSDSERCRECWRAESRKGYPAAVTKTEIRIRNTAARRRYSYKKNYKITEAEYDQMLEDQGFACYICKKDASEFNRRLSVDHNRNCCPGQQSCGKCVRALLCGSCNMAIGAFKDSEEMLYKAIEYLQHYTNRLEGVKNETSN